MEKNENLFSFGKINKYFIIPFLCPIFLFLTNYFISLYVNIFFYEIKFDDDNDDKLYYDLFKRKSYLISSIAFLSYFAGGSLYFISYIRTGVYNRESKEINSLIIILSILFALSLLFCIDVITSLYFINKKAFEKNIYYLIFMPIFSKFILKNELFKHQILSLFIFLVGLFLLLIPYFSNEKKLK